MAQKGLLTISAFTKLLQKSFPGLTQSKVRYLEREGLIKPERTSGGYRLFSEQDVAVAKRILTMQANDYLPLKVIRARLLEDGDGAQKSQNEGAAQTRFEDSAAFEVYKDTKYHFIEQAQAELHVPVAFIQELAKCGFLKLHESSDKKVQVSGLDYPHILRCYELQKAGIEPRNIRFLVIGAGHQISLLEQVHSTEQPSDIPLITQNLCQLMEAVQAHMVLSTFNTRRKEK